MDSNAHKVMVQNVDGINFGMVRDAYAFPVLIHYPKRNAFNALNIPNGTVHVVKLNLDITFLGLFIDMIEFIF